MTTHYFKKRTLSKLISIAAVSASLFISGCAEEAQPGMDYSKHITRGESYLKQGQFNAAVIEARNAIQKAPEEVATHLFLANIFLEMGQAKAALNQLDQIQNNSSPAYLFTKTQAFNESQKYKSARKLLTDNQATLLANDNNRYLKLSAASQLGLGNINQAQSLLRQLLKSSPGDINTLVSLAKAAAMSADIDLSQQYLTEALEKEPDNTDALVLKAKIQYNSNQLSAAEDTLTLALSTLPSTDRITPQRITILSTLADILTQQGRSNEAMIYTRILAEALPGQSELKSKYNQVLNLIKEEKIDEAEALLEEIIAEAPGFEAASQLLGLLKYNRGDLDAANQYFVNSIDPEIADENAILAYAMTNFRLNNSQKVLDILEDQISDIDNVQLLSIYGLAALSDNQTSKGETALNKALLIDPQRSRLRLALANSYNINQLPEKALDQLKQAYQTTPSDPFIQKALLQQYGTLNLKPEADTFIETLKKEQANNVSSLILVGRYEYYIGKENNSITSLKKALEIDPSNPETMNALGTIYLLSKNYKQATSIYQDMMKKHPELTIAYKGLFSSLESQNKPTKAIEEISAVAENSNHHAPYSVLVEYFARNGEFDKAAEYLLLAQQKFPQNADINRLSTKLSLTKGRQAFNNQELSKTRQIVMEELKNNPANVDLLALLIDTEIVEKNYLEASKLTDQLAIDNGNLAMLFRGIIATAQEKHTIALNHYQTLWKNQPSDKLAQRIYSNYTIQNKAADANTFMHQWTENFPNSIAMLTIKSAHEISNKDYDEAIKSLEKALETQRSNPSPLLLNNLAWAYLQSGNTVAAKKNAKQAYDLSPKSAAIADTYGWILLKTGNTNEAKKILKIAYDLAPDNDEIATHWKQANQN